MPDFVVSVFGVPETHGLGFRGLGFGGLGFRGLFALPVF